MMRTRFGLILNSITEVLAKPGGWRVPTTLRRAEDSPPYQIYRVLQVPLQFMKGLARLRCGRNPIPSIWLNPTRTPRSLRFAF